MQSEYYKKYMKSAGWRAKCQQRIEISGHKCEMCGRLERNCRNGLQIHHISYRNLGHEDVYRDLICLCGSCHIKIHAYYNRCREPCEAVES